MMTALLEDKSTCLLCQRSMETLIKLRTDKVEAVFEEKIVGIVNVMTEREKAAINAAQTLITKDGQEQLNKFVLKQELSDRIKLIQEQLTGTLGLELRMRSVEQAKGVVDAKMYMIVIGLSALITAGTTVIIHTLFKF